MMASYDGLDLKLPNSSMGYFDFKKFNFLIIKWNISRRHTLVVFGQGTRPHFNSLFSCKLNITKRNLPSQLLPSPENPVLHVQV